MRCPNCDHEFKERGYHPQFREDAIEIMKYLNKRAGRNFNVNKPVNIAPITMLMKNGASKELLKAVIDNKWLEWKDDPKTRVWVRPSTLFSVSGFAKYEGVIDMKAPKELRRASNRCKSPDCRLVGTMRDSKGVVYCGDHFRAMKLREEEELNLKFGRR